MSDPITVIIPETEVIIIETPAAQGPPGPQGATGNTGPQGADGRGVSWKGPFNPSNSYSAPDAVEYLGNSYVCIANTTHNPVDEPQSWDLLAAAGAKGEQGKSILYGTDDLSSNNGYPDDSFGNEGDFYIDEFISDDPYLLGPKFNGTWTANFRVRLRGEDGSNGINGYNITDSTVIDDNTGNLIVATDRPTVANTNNFQTSFGEPALLVPAGHYAVASINGVEVTFSNSTTGFLTYGDYYAVEEDMAADINAANIPYIVASYTSNNLILTNTDGNAIECVNITPDFSGTSVFGNSSGTGIPLETSAAGRIDVGRVVGADGADGVAGQPGSDANVDYANVISAIGYVPLDANAAANVNSVTIISALGYVPANTNAVTSETSARVAADLSINNSIVLVNANVSTNANAIAAETVARGNAVSSEANSRIAADGALTASLSLVNANVSTINSTLSNTNGNVIVLQGNVVTLTARATVTSANVITALGYTPLANNQVIAITGDVSGSGSNAISLTLSNSGVTAGTYTVSTITVDAKGRITAASNGASSATSIAPRATYTVSTVTIASNAITIDLSAASQFNVSLNSNITSITVSNPPATGLTVFVLKFTADGTGRSITWPASFHFNNGVTPTMSSSNGKVDYITCLTSDGGTTYFAGTWSQNA